MSVDYRQFFKSARYRTSSIEGRCLLEETESDRGRIMQSAALRRLQQKTQVYPLETNAAVRTRLTHSLEVMQTGRFIARKVLEKLAQQGQLDACYLKGNEIVFLNLVEMACLLHDVGNPPFGHFGEKTFNEWLGQNLASCYQKANQGVPSELYQAKLEPDLLKFEGNAQSIRILHSLGQLNLTLTQLGSVIKYPCAAWHLGSGQPYKKNGYYYSESDLVEQINQTLEVRADQRHPLVYIMEAADDIAYCIADLEDAIDKKVLELTQLQHLLKTEWAEIASNQSQWMDEIVDSCAKGSGSAHEFITKFRTQLVGDLVEYSAKCYCDKQDQIFKGDFKKPLIHGQTKEHLALKVLKKVAQKYVFSSAEVQTPEIRGYSALTGLLDLFKLLLELPEEAFDSLFADPKQALAGRLYNRMASRHKQAYHQAVGLLSQKNYKLKERQDLKWYYRVRLVLDYLSGMTDHFVVTEYQTLKAMGLSAGSHYR